MFGGGYNGYGGYPGMNEHWGGHTHHQHYNPQIYSGMPTIQVGHHRGEQVAGGFSATDPWLNSSVSAPMNVHHMGHGSYY